MDQERVRRNFFSHPCKCATWNKHKRWVLPSTSKVSARTVKGMLCLFFFFFFLNILERTEMRAFSGSWEFSFRFSQMGQVGFGWAQPTSVLAQLSIAVLKWESLPSAERYTHHHWAHHQISVCTSSWMSSLARLHGGLSVTFCIRYKAIPIAGESGKMAGHHLDGKQQR